MNGIPLSVDWLALSLRLQDRVSGCPDRHRWAYYSPTNVWSSRWCLYNEWGDKVFTLLFQPRSKILKANRAVMEVANEWLYHGLGITGCLRLLSQCCHFDVTGVSRVDLACDFCPDNRQHDIICGLNDTSMYVSGKRNGSGFWSTVHDTKLHSMWQNYCPHDMNWGHKTSDVKWKLYYKSKELRDEANGFGWSKPYIVDMWNDVGLDVTNVWRLEVSIHNCNNFDFMGKRLTFNELVSHPVDIYKSLYTSRFQVCRNQHHKDKTNDERVEFLPVGRLRGAFRVHRDEHIVEHNSGLTLLRHLVADVQTEQVLLCDELRESCLEAIERVVTAGRMERYFVMVTGQEFDDWREWLRCQAYYFGVENLSQNTEDDTIIEMAMVEAGLIDTDPLGAPSSLSPQRSATQLRLELP